MNLSVIAACLQTLAPIYTLAVYTRIMERIYSLSSLLHYDSAKEHSTFEQRHTNSHHHKRHIGITDIEVARIWTDSRELALQGTALSVDIKNCIPLNFWISHRMADWTISCPQAEMSQTLTSRAFHLFWRATTKMAARAQALFSARIEQAYSKWKRLVGRHMLVGDGVYLSSLGLYPPEVIKNLTRFRTLVSLAKRRWT